MFCCACGACGEEIKFKEKTRSCLNQAGSDFSLILTWPAIYVACVGQVNDLERREKLGRQGKRGSLMTMPFVTGPAMFNSHGVDGTNHMRGYDDKIGNNESNGSKDVDGESGGDYTSAQSVSLQHSRLGTHREYNAILPTTLLPSPFPF